MASYDRYVVSPRTVFHKSILIDLSSGLSQGFPTWMKGLGISLEEEKPTEDWHETVAQLHLWIRPGANEENYEDLQVGDGQNQEPHAQRDIRKVPPKFQQGFTVIFIFCWFTLLMCFSVLQDQRLVAVRDLEHEIKDAERGQKIGKQQDPSYSLTKVHHFHISFFLHFRSVHLRMKKFDVKF